MDEQEVLVMSTDHTRNKQALKFAEFKVQLQGQVFDIWVTKCPGQSVRLTHAKSGMGIPESEITKERLNAALGDYEVAGRVTIDAIIEAKGARLASKLRELEA